MGSNIDFIFNKLKRDNDAEYRGTFLKHIDSYLTRRYN